MREWYRRKVLWYRFHRSYGNGRVESALKAMRRGRTYVHPSLRKRWRLGPRKPDKHPSIVKEQGSNN